VTSVSLAGAYAAVVNEGTEPHYDESGSTVTVFDLRTGATVPDRGGEAVGCPITYCNLDQLVLGPDAVTAAHTTTSYSYCPPTAACTTTEQIVANDSTGTRTLDTATTPAQYRGATPSLTGLTLTGDTLTWNHGGIQRTAQLYG
jgi:hypothetical protein